MIGAHLQLRHTGVINTNRRIAEVFERVVSIGAGNIAGVQELLTKGHATEIAPIQSNISGRKVQIVFVVTQLHGGGSTHILVDTLLAANLQPRRSPIKP